jgi:hypothetical protein
MKRLNPLAWSILAIAWVIFLIAPLAFLFDRKADTSASLDWFSGIYEGFVGLLGDQTGRWVFCGSWLVLNALLFWGVMLRKSEPDTSVPPDIGD